MEILGVGPSEFIFVIIIALLVLGPKDMQKAGRTIGKWMRDIVKSDGWKIFQQTSNELRNLPARMMRDANEDLEDFNMQIKAGMDMNKPSASPARSVSTDSTPASKPPSDLPPSEETETTPEQTPVNDSPENGDTEKQP